MNNPSYEHFALNKIQRQKNGGLSINYSTFITDGERMIEEVDNKKSERIPCDELITAINKLKEPVCKVINYTKFRSVISDNDFKCTEDQSRFITSLYNSLYQGITINNLQLWADGELITACVIGYSLTGYNAQQMDHKTYKISLEEFEHGFEDDLRDICDEIRKESYQYLFENKGGQLTIMDAE